jgi:4-amino-4-deoxy-L-arabinose transferase-like glycosyltransferase
VVVAFIGRILFIVTFTRHETALYDNFYYINEAKTVAEGRGFVTPLFGSKPTAEHPPLTVATLVPVSVVTDGNEVAMRVTMAALGAGVVVLVALIGVQVAGERAGLIAAGLAAIYPNLWLNDGLVMAETLTALLVAAVIFCCYQLARGPTVAHAAGAGLACGLAMLTRAELVLLVPLVVIPTVFLLRGPSRAQRVKLAAVIVFVALLAISPWVAYNFSRFDQPVFLSHGDGGVLLGANCDDTYSGSRIGTWTLACAAAAGTRGDNSQMARRQRERASDYIRAHLDRVPFVVAARVGRVWSVYRPVQMADISEQEGRPKVASLVGVVMFWVLALLAVAGAVTLRRRRVPLLPLLGPFVMVTVVAAVSYGIVRFRVPAEISLVVLAAIGIEAILISRRRPTSITAPS